MDKYFHTVVPPQAGITGSVSIDLTPMHNNNTTYCFI